MSHALESNPDHVESLQAMAIALDSTGDPEQAMRILEHALRLSPSSAEALANLGTMNDGERRRIWIEIFEIDAATLSELDALEAPYGYWRETTGTRDFSSSNRVPCVVPVLQRLRNGQDR